MLLRQHKFLSNSSDNSISCGLGPILLLQPSTARKPLMCGGVRGAVTPRVLCHHGAYQLMVVSHRGKPALRYIRSSNKNTGESK